MKALVIAVSALTFGVLPTQAAHADPTCIAGSGCSNQPWNGQLMPTWNTPGFYGGWTTTPVICDQFTLSCRGYADQPNS